MLVLEYRFKGSSIEHKFGDYIKNRGPEKASLLDDFSESWWRMSIQSPQSLYLSIYCLFRPGPCGGDGGGSNKSVLDPMYAFDKKLVLVRTRAQ